jgi:hypothetical protein
MAKVRIGPSEEVMARSVVTELQRQGFDVYEEVSTGYGGRRADIVGVRGPAVMIVECKTSLSLKLLDQLVSWQGCANWIVGAYGGGRVGRAVTALCKGEGVGLWSVGHTDIDERIPPRFTRRSSGAIKSSLFPEQRSAEYAKAGSQGGYYTPFRSTCRALYDVAREHPGIPLRDAIRRIKHHYSTERSAVSALPALIRRGVVEGVRITNGAPLRIYLEGITPSDLLLVTIPAKEPTLFEGQP